MNGFLAKHKDRFRTISFLKTKWTRSCVIFKEKSCLYWAWLKLPKFGSIKYYLMYRLTGLLLICCYRRYSVCISQLWRLWDDNQWIQAVEMCLLRRTATDKVRSSVPQGEIVVEALLLHIDRGSLSGTGSAICLECRGLLSGETLWRTGNSLGSYWLSWRKWPRPVKFGFPGLTASAARLLMEDRWMWGSQCKVAVDKLQCWCGMFA